MDHKSAIYRTMQLLHSSAPAHSPLRIQSRIITRTGRRVSLGGLNSESSVTVPVRFVFRSQAARSVCVAGSFNGWNQSATPLVHVGEGKWLRLLWLPPGRHEYLFVADGVWFFDPEATDYVPNVYGTLNSLITVFLPSKGASGDEWSRRKRVLSDRFLRPPCRIAGSG